MGRGARLIGLLFAVAGLLTAGAAGFGRALPGGSIALTMDERIYLVDVRSGLLHRLDVPGSPSARTLGWSADGASLYVYGYAGLHERRVYAFDVNSRRFRPLYDTARDMPDLAASPDGERLAYSDGRDLYIARLNDPASRSTLRSFDSLYVRVIAWSPNGRQIAVFGSAGLGAYGIYWVDVVDGALRRLVVGDGYDWSPDGVRAVYGNANQLTLLDLASRQSRPLASGFSPTWSPDGQWLALARLADAHYLIVRHVDSGVERTLVRSEQPIGALDWRPG